MQMSDSTNRLGKGSDRGRGLGGRAITAVRRWALLTRWFSMFADTDGGEAQGTAGRGLGGRATLGKQAGSVWRAALGWSGRGRSGPLGVVRERTLHDPRGRHSASEGA